MRYGKFVAGLLAGSLISFGVTTHAQKEAPPTKSEGAAPMARTLDTLKEIPNVPQEMVDNWKRFGTPGEEHAEIAKGAGKWKVTQKYWHDPSAPPQVSEGHEIAEMILGGRFLKFEMEAKVMGLDFRGYGLIGYDNLRGEYTSIWMDTFTTQMMVSTGTYDEKSSTYTFLSTMDDLMTGERGVPVKFTVTKKGDDHQRMQMWVKDQKTMESNYERM